MSDNVKTAIFKKGIKSIPNVIWVLCASYALVMGTNVVVLKFADIDADKHINRYLDIILSEREAKPNKQTDLAVQNLQIQVNELGLALEETKRLVKELKADSHSPTKVKKDDI